MENIYKPDEKERLNTEIVYTVLRYINNEYTMLNILEAYPFLTENIPNSFKLKIDNLFIYGDINRFKSVKNLSINTNKLSINVNIFTNLNRVKLSVSVGSLDSITKNNPNIEILSLKPIILTIINFSEYSSLRVLKLENINLESFTEIPKNLQSLSLKNCTSINCFWNKLVDSKIDLRKIKIIYDHNIIEYNYQKIGLLLNSIEQFKMLEKLTLKDCIMLQAFDSKIFSNLTRLTALKLYLDYPLCLTDDIFTNMDRLETLMTDCDIASLTRPIYSVKKLGYRPEMVSENLDRLFPNCTEIKVGKKDSIRRLKHYHINVLGFNPKLFSGLKRLTVLNISFSEDSIRSLTELESLSITGTNRYSGFSLEFNKKLKHLTIENCNYFEIDFISQCTKLESFRIVNSISNVSNSLFINIPNIRFIEFIAVDDIHNIFLKHIKDKMINRLSLRGCKKINYQSLKYIRQMKNIEYLDLEGTRVSMGDISTLRYKEHINFYNSIKKK